MPELTGIELARETQSFANSLPIIICSGFSELLNAEQASEQGINAFLYKPVTMPDLARVLREVLEINN